MSTWNLRFGTAGIEMKRRYAFIPTKFLRVGKALFASLAMFVAACNFGPRELEQGHLAYNAALNSAVDEELLLNIVRLRYLDTIEFLSVTSISSQASFSVGLGAEVGRSTGFPEAVGFGDFTFSRRPTFTFTPERGLTFAKKLVEPIDLDVLAFLINADWDANRLFRIFVRGVNGMENEFGLPNRRFAEVVTHIAALQARNEMFVGFKQSTETLSDPIDAKQISGRDVIEAARSGYRFESISEGGRLVLTGPRRQAFFAFERESADSLAVIRLLGLTPNQKEFDLIPGPLRAGQVEERDSITVRTRSLLGALGFLSQGVKVPPSHLGSGLAPRDWPAGAPGLEIDELFQVLHSTTNPQARLSVFHRGHWFYLDDTEVDSRATFLHVAELFRLSLVDPASQNAPVLTLPVGGS